MSLISGSHPKDITHITLGERCTRSVVQQIAHHVERQNFSWQVQHSDVSDQPGSAARTARSTGYDPNFRQNESGTMYISIADGEDEDLMRVENSSSDKIMFFK